jgi:hypothetical protein
MAVVRFAAVAIRNLKMNNATADCMRNSVGAPDRIEFVHQCTYMEFGRMDRYAKTAGYRLVGHALCKKSEYLKLAWG